jgi:hypothetical protein
MYYAVEVSIVLCSLLQRPVDACSSCKLITMRPLHMWSTCAAIHCVHISKQTSGQLVKYESLHSIQQDVSINMHTCSLEENASIRYDFFELVSEYYRYTSIMNNDVIFSDVTTSMSSRSMLLYIVYGLSLQPKSVH